MKPTKTGRLSFRHRHGKRETLPLIFLLRSRCLNFIKFSQNDSKTMNYMIVDDFFALKSFCHVCPLQAETSLTENITNKESYFRAVTFTPMVAEEGQDKKQCDDNDDSYTTYSYEYESNENENEDYNAPQTTKPPGANSDKKLFRSTDIVINKDSVRKGKNDETLEEELLLETLKEGTSTSEPNQVDYQDEETSPSEPDQVGHQDKDLKTRKKEKKEEFEDSNEMSKEVYLTRRGGSGESQASWGLAAFIQPGHEHEPESHDYGDSRSSFITFASVLLAMSWIIYAFAEIICVTVSLTST